MGGKEYTCFLPLVSMILEGKECSQSQIWGKPVWGAGLGWPVTFSCQLSPSSLLVSHVLPHMDKGPWMPLKDDY
jgi:hypothetical protein